MGIPPPHRCYTYGRWKPAKFCGKYRNAQETVSAQTTKYIKQRTVRKSMMFCET
ncbi:MAG: hypothetical protein GY820_08290 [Gammaproteobacteria bacterium]|nr:hypothetical protein [Gammaproteobacteria bacterium]